MRKESLKNWFFSKYNGVKRKFQDFKLKIHFYKKSKEEIYIYVSQFTNFICDLNAKLKWVGFFNYMLCIALVDTERFQFNNSNFGIFLVKKITKNRLNYLIPRAYLICWRLDSSLSSTVLNIFFWKLNTLKSILFLILFAFT